MSNWSALFATPSPKNSADAILMKATIRQARIDPCAFLPLILQGQAAGHRPMAAAHRALQNHLSEQSRALVELPRDHGKTTQVCLRVVWELGRNPNLRVKIVCASEAIAVDRSRYLRQLIAENPRVRQVFPHLKPGEPWAATAFAVQRRPGILGPSVAAFGVGAASTGTRADLLVCDDIVDVKAAYSKAERERVSESFLNNLLNLLEPDGRFWGLSTPWHADDLNARLRRNGGFSLFRRAIGPDLSPVWPARWPRKELAKRRAEIGSAAFARGYLLTPIAEDELLIRPEWVRLWTELPADFDRVILAVDPAVTVKASSDASGLVILAKAGNAIYCLAAIAQKTAAPGLIERIVEMDSLWQPQAILFESNGAFEAVKDLLVRHAAFGAKVIGVKQSKAKAARIAAFAVSVENGTFRLHHTHENLFVEMCSFPFNERDDLVDAAAMGTNYLLTLVREPRIWLL